MSNLYLFDLPVELIDSLRPRELIIPEDHPLHPSKRASAAAATTADGRGSEAPVVRQDGQGSKYYCVITGASFDSLEGLRQHYKTDWYRYNLKLKSQGKAAGVSEEQFNSLVEGLSDSLSGTDTATDDEDAQGDDSDHDQQSSLARVLAKQSLSNRTQQAITNDDDDELEALASAPRSALLWFESPQTTQSTQYGVYRATLPSLSKKPNRDGPKDGELALQDLRSIQIKPDTAPEQRTWTLLMFGGGHFAGMVVSLVPKLVSKGKGREKERQVVVLHSKTFHRYTTRRKQGGGQGANDAANGKAKSAGAQIRRHNEAMLTDEVRSVLTEWSDAVRSSELVFMRASKTNHRIFYDFEGSPLERGDPRIRGFSFPTKRPTLAELTRAFMELTRVKVTHLSEQDLAQLDQAYLDSIKKSFLPAPQPSPTPIAPASKAPAVPKLTKEQEIERDRWERLVDMVKRGRIEAVESFLDKYGPEIEHLAPTHASGGGPAPWGSLPTWMSERTKTPTLLHVASAADQPDMVRWLLETKRADPTLGASFVSSGSQGDADEHEQEAESEARYALTPYELAPSRSTRNVFRLVANAHPDWWDWLDTTSLSGARLPSALSEEKEEEREQKGKERRNKLREKLKERDRERAAKEQAEQAERDERESKIMQEEREKNRGAQQQARATGPQKLGGLGATNKVGAAGSTTAALTDEQKMRLMREQRARAAEARLKGPSTS